MPPPKLSPLGARTCMCVPGGGVLTCTKSGIEIGLRQGRSFPSGNSSFAKMMQGFDLSHSCPMAINIRDSTIILVTFHISIRIYRELMDTNIFLMERKGHFYLCCTNADMTALCYL